jgi:hypothetical protein
MNIQYVIDQTGHPTSVIMPLAWYQQITQESISRPAEISLPSSSPLASPTEIFNLFTNIYEGWSAAEIDEVETLILNRQHFFKEPSDE